MQAINAVTNVAQIDLDDPLDQEDLHGISWLVRDIEALPNRHHDILSSGDPSGNAVIVGVRQHCLDITRIHTF